MPTFRYCARLGSSTTPILALLLGGLTLAGCSAVNPLAGVPAGDAAAWGSSSSPRVAVSGRASRPTARPSRTAAAPAEEPEARTTNARRRPIVRAEAPVLAGSSAVAASLRDTGSDWIGTPYRFGGETRRGIDCSAFTRSLMQETFGLALPRNTTLQVQEGEPVERHELIAGDLVFFRRGGTRHVGVYLGDNEFIHASSSRGVTVSDLDDAYFRQHYWTARRVLAGEAPLFASAAPQDRPRRRADRVEEALVRFAAAEADSAAAAPDRGAW